MFWTAITDILKPISAIIDNLHASDTEKAKAQGALAQAQLSLVGKALDMEQANMDARAKIVAAEASSGGWLTRSWRPIAMLTFLFLVVCHSFGLLVTPLDPQAWRLLQLGLGGYVVGRSAEKLVPKILETVKSGS